MEKQIDNSVENDRYYVALIDRSDFHIRSWITIQEKHLNFLKQDSSKLRKTKTIFHPTYYFAHPSQYPEKVREFMYEIDRRSDSTYVVCTYDIKPEDISNEELMKGLKWVEMLERSLKMGFPETGVLKSLL